MTMHGRWWAGLALSLLLALPTNSSTESEWYVNRNTQDDGDHEVHRVTCRYLPAPRNRIALGDHDDCRDALRAAREHFEEVDGCYYCARACDTG